MLVKELNKWDLQKEFQEYDRDYYSLDAYQAIIDYFEEFDNFDLDVIALCCDFEEEDEEYIRSCYYIDEDEDVIDYLSYRTWCQELDDTILYISF